MKHLCLAHQDEELELYLEECGLEGYGFWWLLLEHIGAPLEPGSVQCWQSHSEGKWAQILHVSTRGFRKFSNSLAVRKLILIENFDDSGLKRLKISIPNLLKYRDEYTSRSGETREKQPTSIGSRADTEQIQSRADTEQTNVPRSKKIPLDEDERMVERISLPVSFVPSPSSSSSSSSLNTPPTPKNGAGEMEQFEFRLKVVATEIHDRHPSVRRDLGIKGIADRLRKICNKAGLGKIGLLDKINRSHLEHCNSAQWQEIGDELGKGQFAKGLENWLAPTMHRWEVVAEAPLFTSPKSPPMTEAQIQEKARQMFADSERQKREAHENR